MTVSRGRRVRRRRERASIRVAREAAARRARALRRDAGRRDHPRHGTRRARDGDRRRGRRSSTRDIPGFPLSTVESHAGRLLCGTLGGKTVVAMQGRFHRYEGYSLQQVTFPVRVLRALGATTLVVSNACGGMNPLWAAGDLMLIADHINLLGDSPLIGPNDDRLGPRFPDHVSAVRRRRFARSRARSRPRQGIAAARRRVRRRRRARISRRAPSIAFCARIGADVVGMSTVPEVIVAVHGGHARARAVDHHRHVSSRRARAGDARDRSSPCANRAEPAADGARARRAGAAVTAPTHDAVSAACRRIARRTTSSASCSRAGTRRISSPQTLDGARGRAELRVLRRPADGERQAGHPSRLRAHDQGSLLPPSRDEGLSRARERRAGTRTACRSRSRSRSSSASAASSRSRRSASPSSTGCAARACSSIARDWEKLSARIGVLARLRPSVRHVHERLRRERVVGAQDAVRQGSAVSRAQDPAVLPALRHGAVEPRAAQLGLSGRRGSERLRRARPRRAQRRTRCTDVGGGSSSGRRRRGRSCRTPRSRCIRISTTSS